MNYGEDAVGADELPRHDRLAASAWVADQSLRVDRSQAAVSQSRAGRAAVHLGLVDVDSFFILGSGSSWRPERCAGTRGYAVAGGFRWGRIIPGISDVVINTGEGNCATRANAALPGEGTWP